MFRNRVLSRFGGRPSDTRVVVGVFEGFGYRFRLVLNAEVALFAVGGESKHIRFCRPNHGLQSAVDIHGKVFGDSVCDHAHAMVPNHAVGFVGG